MPKRRDKLKWIRVPITEEHIRLLQEEAKRREEIVGVPVLWRDVADDVVRKAIVAIQGRA